jgi:hypothetical protein
VARDWDSYDTDDGFVAWYGAPTMTCALSAGSGGQYSPPAHGPISGTGAARLLR